MKNVLLFDQRALASCMKSPILLMEYLGDDCPFAVDLDDRVGIFILNNRVNVWCCVEKFITLHRFLASPCDGKLRSNNLILSNTNI